MRKVTCGGISDGRRTLAAAFAWAVLGLAGARVDAAVLRVDDDAGAGGDGASWTAPIRFLQDAIALAAAGGVEEIRVAGGIYRPDRTAAVPAGTGDRLATFALVDGVAIRGGFAGVGAPDPDARDIIMHVTVLSGDLAGNDGPDFLGNDENVRHVVDGSGAGPGAALDGMTITGGNGGGTFTNPDRFGGGMLNRGGSPTVTACAFVANVAEFGGALFNDSSGAPTFDRCDFVGNVANQQGGGVYTNAAGGGPVFVSCRLLGNSSAHTAGGAYVRQGATFLNGLVAGNEAVVRGGGVYVIAGAPLLVNCTIIGNTAGIGGGIMNTCAGACSETLLRNVIIAGNQPDQIIPGDSQAVIEDSIVEGGWAGAGVNVMNVDPLLADPDGADDVAGTTDDNPRPTPGSPAVDAGNDAHLPARIATDLNGRARFVDGTLDGSPTVDLGPLEFDPEAGPVAEAAVAQLTNIGTAALVRLDGAASADPDDPIGGLIFEWDVDGAGLCAGPITTCGVVEALLAFGPHDVLLRVTDPGGCFDEHLMTIVVDPAALPVLDVNDLMVWFDGGRLRLGGAVALPAGVDFREVAPLVSVVVRLGGQTAVHEAVVALPIGGAGATPTWCYRRGVNDDGGATGVTRLDIDWSGARFLFVSADAPVALESDLITTTETRLEIRFDPAVIGGAFTVDVDGLARIDVAEDGTAAGDVPLEVRKGQVTAVLPFPLTDDSAITLTGAVALIVPVADHLTYSLGGWQLEAGFDAWALPRSGEDVPVMLELEVRIGATGYAGVAVLGDREIEVAGRRWRR